MNNSSAPSKFLLKKCRLKSEGKEKYLFFLGEIHLYNYEESKWAENFLEKEKIEFVFAEGVNFGIEKYWYGVLGIFQKYIFQRKYPTVKQLAEKIEIPVLRLEENYVVPFPTKFLIIFGMTMLVVLILMVALLISGLIPRKISWHITAILVLTALSLVVLLINVDYLSPKREKIWIDSLKTYNKELKFQNSVAVFGKSHFNSIIDRCGKSGLLIGICEDISGL